MILDEIFDSSIPNLDWKKVNRFELTQFEVDGLGFVIQIEKKRLNLSSIDKFKTAEVSFF